MDDISIQTAGIFETTDQATAAKIIADLDTMLAKKFSI